MAGRQSVAALGILRTQEKVFLCILVLWIKVASALEGLNYWVRGRVLARISKMPVQNSNFKISAHPDLATNLLQILVPTTFGSLVSKRVIYTSAMS